MAANGPPLPAPPDASAVLKQLNILEACNTAFPIVACIAFVARVYVRTGMLRRFSPDDWAMGIALIFFIGNCATGIVLTHKQRALFSGEVTVGELAATLLKVQTLVRLVNTFYTLTIVAVKISLGYFFLHIFNVNQTFQRGCIYVMTALSATSGIVYVVLIEGTCGITFAFSSHCAITHAFNAYSDTWSIINAVSDIIFTVLSLNALWGTQLRRYVKISAMALLAFASVGGAVSIVRAVVTIVPAKDSIVQVLEIGRWSTVEAGIYIVTGSLVTLRPLLQRVWQSVSDTTTGLLSGTRAIEGDVTTERNKSMAISVTKGGINQVTTFEVKRNSEMVQV